MVRGGTGLPPVDRLLQFLVDSSADGEEDVQCANCDRSCAKAVRAAGPAERAGDPRWGRACQQHPLLQELDTMYFCNTCGQPLCAPCREETHRAKMFARHEIVSLSKRTKDIHKKCRECHATLCHAAPCRARLPNGPIPCSTARGALHHVLH